MAGSSYIIEVKGILDDSQIRAQIDAINAQLSRMTIGGVSRGTSSATAGLSSTAKQAKNTSKAYGQINKQAKNASKSTSAFASETKRASINLVDVGKKVAAFGAVTSAIQMATAGVRDMVSNVFELDKALTEYRKVSNLSEKGIANMTDKAYKLGKTVSKTGTEMVDAATQFKKSGFSDKDSLQLGKIALMYTNIADEEISAGDAAGFIVSQMKAFNLKANNAEHIIGAVNEVSNNFAVSSADIATNIGKASAALSDGNVTYEQSIGLMTAMTEITRSGSKAARGLVSVQSRYNQIIDKSSSTGKKLTAWYEKHNIQIKDQNGQLRSFYDVGKDVAKVWNQLDDNERKYYLNTQAGANQSQNLSALMRNYQTAIDATNTALGENDSAAKENAKYQESLEGHLENLSSAWENFSRKMVDSGIITGVLKSLTAILNALSSDFGIATIKGVGMFAMLMGGVKVINSVKSAITGLNIAQMFTSATTSATVFTQTLSSGGQAVTKSLKGASAASESAFRGVSKVEKSTSSLGKVASALAPALTNPYLIAAAGALGLAIAVNKLNDPQRKFAKAQESVKEAKDDYDNAASMVEKYRQEVIKANNAGKSDKSAKENLKYYKAQLAIKKQIYEYSLKEEQAAWEKSKKVTKYGGADGTERQETTTGEEALAKSKNYYKDASDALAKYNELVVQGKGNTKEALGFQERYIDSYKKYGESLKQVKKEQKEYNEHDVSNLKNGEKTKKQLNAFVKGLKKREIALADNSKAANKLSKKFAKGTLFNPNEVNSTVKQFKKLGQNIGVVANKAGKIQRVDVGKFAKTLGNAGVSAKDTLKYLKGIADSNPKVKIKLNGEKVAIKNLRVLNGELVSVNSKEWKAHISSNAKSEEKKVDSFQRKVSGLPNKTVKIGADTSAGESAINRFANWASSKIQSIKDALSNAHEKNGTRHFASGTPNAEVNEQGFEIIESPSGYMRVANAGKRGVTHIERGSAVYTHGQSMRMLQKAGMTEANLLQGRKGDVSVYGVSKLEGFAKGLSKKEKKAKSKNQEAYNNNLEKLQNWYDSQIEKAEHIQAVNHYSDEWLLKKRNAIAKAYKKKLAVLNKKTKKTQKNKRTRANLTKSLSREERYETQELLADIRYEAATSQLDNLIDKYATSNISYKDALAQIRKFEKEKKISAKEAAEYIEQLNEQEVEKTKTAYEKKTDFLSQYLDYQISQEEKANELLEEQANLLDASSKKVKVYQEGLGFVYQQDESTIKEAQSSSSTSVWQQAKDALEDAQTLSDLFNTSAEAGSESIKEVLSAGGNLSALQAIIQKYVGGSGGYNLGSDYNITDPSKYKVSTTGDKTTITIGSLTLPDVTDSKGFVDGLNSIARQSIY